MPERHPDAPAPGTILPSHYSQCFGCGEAQVNGLRMEISAREGNTFAALFTVTTAHQGAPGLAHGGVLAAAFDETLGATVGMLMRHHAVTGKLETDFLHPVPVGSTLHIVSKLDGVAGRKIYASAEGRLNAEDGTLALRARALFIKVDASHFIKHGRRTELRQYAEENGITRPDVEINP
jgi:acyl-coenzyme A thioesterase PaaI-like protein